MTTPMPIEEALKVAEDALSARVGGTKLPGARECLDALGALGRLREELPKLGPVEFYARWIKANERGWPPNLRVTPWSELAVNERNEWTILAEVAQSFIYPRLESAAPKEGSWK